MPFSNLISWVANSCCASVAGDFFIKMFEEEAA